MSRSIWRCPLDDGGGSSGGSRTCSERLILAAAEGRGRTDGRTTVTPSSLEAFFLSKENIPIPNLFMDHITMNRGSEMPSRLGGDLALRHFRWPTATGATVSPNLPGILITTTRKGQQPSTCTSTYDRANCEDSLYDQNKPFQEKRTEIQGICQGGFMRLQIGYHFWGKI